MGFHDGTFFSRMREYGAAIGFRTAEKFRVEAASFGWGVFGAKTIEDFFRR